LFDDGEEQNINSPTEGQGRKEVKIFGVCGFKLVSHKASNPHAPLNQIKGSYKTTQKFQLLHPKRKKKRLKKIKKN